MQTVQTMTYKKNFKNLQYWSQYWKAFCPSAPLSRPLTAHLKRTGPNRWVPLLTNPWFTFDITLLQRLTIIESPTTDDYDYYDEFSQVSNTSFHTSKISLLTPFPPSSLWTPPTLTRTCATLLLVRWTQGMLTHARSATRSSRALGNWGTYHISWKHQLQK